MVVPGGGGGEIAVAQGPRVSPFAAAGWVGQRGAQGGSEGVRGAHRFRAKTPL